MVQEELLSRSHFYPFNLPGTRVYYLESIDGNRWYHFPCTWFCSRYQTHFVHLSYRTGLYFVLLPYVCWSLDKASYLICVNYTCLTNKITSVSGRSGIYTDMNIFVKCSCSCTVRVHPFNFYFSLSRFRSRFPLYLLPT